MKKSQQDFVGGLIGEKEAARILGITVPTLGVRRRIDVRSGRPRQLAPPHIRAGAAVLYEVSVVEKFKEENKNIHAGRPRKVPPADH
jgi:hypothetical protein